MSIPPSCEHLSYKIFYICNEVRNIKLNSKLHYHCFRCLTRIEENYEFPLRGNIYKPNKTCTELQNWIREEK